jgi:hypothetical protein
MLKMLSFLIDNFITIAFCCGTVGYALRWYFFDFRSIVSGVDKSTKELSQTPIHLSELYQLFKGSKLENDFNKYLKTFFQDQSSNWHTLSPASEYLNVNHLLGVENLKRWQTAANIMLGLGILGTFVGLTMGLSHFDMATHEQIMQSIQTLIPSMRTAFITSVAGMFTSLLANAIQKRNIKRISDYLGGFCEKLDDNFFMGSEKEIDLFYAFKNDLGQRVYPAQFMQNIMRDSSEQTRGIKRFTEDLAEGIILSSETMDLLADKIAGALERPMVQHMLPVMQDVQKAVDELRSEKQESIQDFISGVSTQFTRSMESIAERLESSLTQSMHERLSGLAQAVADSGAVFEKLPQLMDVQIHNMTETMNHLSVQLREDLQAQQQTVSETNEQIRLQLKSVLDEQTNHFQTVIRLLVTELSDVIGVQQRTVEDLSHKLRGELSSAITQQQAALADQTQAMHAAFSRLLQQESEQLESLMIKLKQQLTEDIDTQQTSLRYFTENIREQTQNASTILGEMLKQLQEQQAVGAQALQEVMGSTHQMLSSFQTSVQNITRAIGNMDDMFTNIQALSNHLSLASNSITQSSKVLSEVTQSFLSQSDQLSDKNQEILVKTIATMQEATNMTQTYVEQFTTIKSGLVKIFADIDQGLKSYRDESRETLNRYLGDFSEHLSDAARTLATSVSGMKQLVEEIETVHQQFPENVASVERLTQRLLQASSSVPATFQRFDEVRAGLERLLTQLPESTGVVHEKA